MSISTPVVNAGQYYINGLELSSLTATTMFVAKGQCRDSTNVNDIFLPADITINAAIQGAAGIDQGALVATTFYAVYAVGDSFGNNVGTAVISANLAAPLMPEGYNMFFRIGYIKTDGAAHILAFRQDGCGLDRWMWYDVAIATGITSGSSATFADVDCSAGLPNSVPTMVNFLCVFTPTAATDTLELKPGDSAATNGYARASGAVAAIAETVNMVCPTDAPNTEAVAYLVTGSAVAIDVAAYLDQLYVTA